MLEHAASLLTTLSRVLMLGTEDRDVRRELAFHTTTAKKELAQIKIAKRKTSRGLSLAESSVDTFVEHIAAVVTSYEAKLRSVDTLTVVNKGIDLSRMSAEVHAAIVSLHRVLRLAEEALHRAAVDATTGGLGGSGGTLGSFSDSMGDLGAPMYAGGRASRQGALSDDLDRFFLFNELNKVRLFGWVV